MIRPGPLVGGLAIVLALPGCAAPSSTLRVVAVHRAPDPGRAAAPRPAPKPGPLLAWPAAGPVSSWFGTRAGRPHDGIDIAVPDGTAIAAAASGVVRYAGNAVRGYGNLILLEHAGGWVTLYAHNQALLVRERQPVGRGEVIALSGHTGNATAPHLHFEVRQGVRPQDPLKYLPPHPAAKERYGRSRSVSRVTRP